VAVHATHQLPATPAHKEKRAPDSDAGAGLKVLALFLGIAVGVLIPIAIWLASSAADARKDARAAAASAATAATARAPAAQLTAAPRRRAR
jgi:hypothetical protein